MRAQDEVALRERLRHVRWLGGGSRAGKTALARRLGSRPGWRRVGTDESMRDHAARCAPEETPLLQAFLAQTMDERWVARTPRVMLETFPWFHGEGFGLVVEDLLRMPAGTCVVVEGFRLLPRLVRPLLDDPGDAVWLLPTPAWR